MISDEETDPKTKKPKRRVLDNMSVAELRDYITALDEEKARVADEIRRKEGSRSAADSFFKA